MGREASDQGEAASRLCDAQSSCLVLMDVQQSLAEAMPHRVLDRLLRSTGLLARGAAVLSVPVCVTLQYPQGLGSLVPSLEKLLPAEARRFEKTAFSVTGVEGFCAYLESLGCRQVILVGMEAHVCILQSALQLQEQGYQVFVVGDATCARARENYENALSRMRAAGIHVTSAESILFEWLRDARHEQFREISRLVC